MRLRESIARNREGLPFSASIKEKIPNSASTLHRLLGVRRHSPHFSHNHANPLPWDVVVVDEASMVDLAMMSKLVNALKPGARLILLGDKDQLASVESGAILADCIQALPENTVTLQKSYRFNQEISAFAQAVNSNNSTAAWAMLSADMQGARTERSLQLLQGPLPDFVVAQYIRYMEKVMALSGKVGPEETIQQLFPALNQFRVLCATRRGPRGVETINHQVEQSLAAAGYPCQPGFWYPGRPVMILHNDYGLNLFNGDIGICLPDRTANSAGDPGSKFKVWFEDEAGSLRGYQPYRLPACETVFAMTIHKSQGSEFGEVLVVLPKEDSLLLTRELIYTAITRAQSRVLIASDQAIFNSAINRAISRSSGLHEMLTHSG
jgi:exodeoxyribonuclease V alpha subunit